VQIEVAPGKPLVGLLAIPTEQELEATRIDAEPM
jgi:hypothetical protein